MLGGTFDPPHVGHAIVAHELLERLPLDRLLVVPAGHPPHRTARFPAQLRYELVRTLFEESPGIEVSDLELRRRGPSYTVDTLARIRTEHRPERLYCIVGDDQYRLLHTWHEPARLTELARLVVVTRGAAGRDDEPSTSRPGGEPDEGRARVPHTRVCVTRVDVSSTQIRERLRQGRSVRFLIPDRIRPRVERAWAELSAGPSSP